MAERMRGLLERLLTRRREAAGEGVPDSELLRRFTHDRDEAAFELLVWRHGGMVLAVCRRTIRDEQLAEDAFQAVFLVLLGTEGGGHSRRTSAAGSLRFRPARPGTSPGSEEAAFRPQPALETQAPPAVDSVARDELSEVLDAEVARLPERLRKPILLCYLGGQSTEDAARELGCPRGTVLSRLAAARKRLAERLTRRGLTLPAALLTVGLSGKLVSLATAAAPAFRTGSFTFSTATQLAEGVLRIMRRTTVSIAMGGVILAVGMVTGFGWVASQHGSKAEAAGFAAAPQPAPVAADPPANPPKPPLPDPIAERKAADERLKRLEDAFVSLRRDIEATEKQIEMLAKASGVKDATRLAILQKQLAEVEEELRRANRELTKLEVEGSVLKKLLDRKDLPVDPGVLQALLKQDVVVSAVATELERARVELANTRQLFPEGDSPQIKKLKDQVVALEGIRRGSESAGSCGVARKTIGTSNRKSRSTRQRHRKVFCETDIQIKKESREKLKDERDGLQKLIDDATKGAINVEDLRKSLEPHREMLARIQREILVIQLQRDGLTLTEQTAADAKLDAILRELAALRKEVKELKEQKK